MLKTLNTKVSFNTMSRVFSWAPIDTTRGRKLDTILDVPQLVHTPAELIKGIWNQENSDKQNRFRFARNISRDDYMVLKSNLEKAPRFVYQVGPEGNQNLMMTGYHYDNLLV